ncbi:MAG: sterol desaturase family protein [Comamonadaceae bacterium]|jgi:lathosterol oxidase|uniref:sterol desaturase family protein n=1 Tax=Candidatus Skiveiella danica TaxID=3386177 RepID=UPI0009CB16C9|nr:sterol desaturase family protein [Comamonadaceae bacterium]MBK8358261.1 sterol desaturase family protein [Comamonadaceae bacterium]MBP8100543.1 sterol desaturase family protein [Burkholderiaceae bacterium]OQC02149.1 MAG: Fatty acid hydroxylase superfamily protein [Alphaproteobacteria bacterium ADurb.Bin100]
MDLLHRLAPPHAVLAPALWAIAFYGVRYLAMAGLAWRVARPTAAGGWGRPHANAPATFDVRRHLRRELGYSLLTLAVFGLVNAALYGWGFIHASRLYYRVADYPTWWFWLSIAVMLVLHDTLFYWLHRAMHWPVLFGPMHRVHHRSIHPTSFAAYSFHPLEAVGEALIVTAIIYLVPVHPLAFVIFQTISTAYNVYGHCGREFWPRGMASHWLGRWINTSTAHAAHHGRGRFNYGLYFLFWDRWMGTLDPDYGRAAPREALAPGQALTG